MYSLMNYAMETNKMMGFKNMIPLIISFFLLHAFLVNCMKGSDDPRSILKTIENGKDVIDCVDIYKQPAFNHPLLKNHTLQLKPSSYPSASEDHNSSEVHTQFWKRNGHNCPQGTVPILRKSVTDLLPKKTHPPRASSTSSTNSSVPSEVNTEYAIGLLEWMNMHGSTGNINLWQPRVYPSEVSTSQIWISDNPVGIIESIQAGYMVTPSNPEPRVFVFWTSDGYKSKGCYNLDCPGFIQTSSKGVVGGLIQPISKYGDDNQQIVTIAFRRDLNNGNWWLIYQGEEIGYWPAELFKNLNTTAKLIEWGGCVVNTKVGKFEIASEMGSGHYPTEGFGKAAFFSNLGFVIEDGEFMDADGLVLQKSKPGCYNIDLNDKTENWGVNFYYGGPGSNSPACIY